MISVSEALERILAGLSRLPAECVGLDRALGRVLAEGVAARRTQPPAAVSAMDGYAVRATDVETPPVTLRRIGEAPAGSAFEGVVKAGETVRIFTGGPVPDGADAIVIQENVTAEGDRVTVRVGAAPGAHIRPAGLDFREGDEGLRPGRVLTARDIGLAAAMNVPWLMVSRRPRVALLATGDELVRPGEPMGPHQIVSSNSLAVAALVRAGGGEAIDLGIALDERGSLEALADGAKGADMLVTLGGASVGDRDLVRTVLGQKGLELDFWRIAMRPGKPLVFGHIDGVPMLGLPGNPVSALVCGLVFLLPAIAAMLGLADPAVPLTDARLGRDLAANDERQDYLRARLTRDPAGARVATPFERQDSSMLSRLAAADCLIVRAPHAPAARSGDPVEIIEFGGGPVGF